MPLFVFGVRFKPNRFAAFTFLMLTRCVLERESEPALSIAAFGLGLIVLSQPGLRSLRSFCPPVELYWLLLDI